MAKKLGLHKHQKEALDLIKDYLKSNSRKSALIQMPTGSGKTGVIAWASHFLTDNNVLILSPRVAIKDQLFKEVKEKFLAKIKVNPSNKKVSVLTHNIDFSVKTIFIDTIQKVDRLRNFAPDKFEQLE
ncbi:DEAD/DEAH box helicase family protein [Pontibacter pudoricolor]|uniref:DEAD/DEAH box helicase family protein n=1 Tax=Pontibacter pudoricolor TaxID=2694930 RepID=UPI0013916E81|nr:DEAD/DEAH box helicase family protein [Pontibacter pudoricolor]